MLSDEEREQVVSALWKWAQMAPDIPVAGFLEGESLLTPRQLAAAVERETADGRALLAILEHGLRREGIEAVVQRLVGNIKD